MFVQTVPASHVFVPPVQATLHGPASPQLTEHVALPPQFIVQPPCGQSTVQALLPVQSSVEPEPIVMLHALPPAHVTLASVPAVRSQLEPPAHWATHPEVHVPVHVAEALHCVVQPEPQLTLHVVPVLHV
jgi:hypothetical protein